MWTQIVGKIRMAHTPMLNHWWQVTLYLTPRGLTTSSIPDRHDAFDMEFEFSEHVLRLGTGNGMSANVNLSPKPVVEFHGETSDAMNRLGIETAPSGRCRTRSNRPYRSPRTTCMPLMTAKPSGCSGIN
ncbi:hypothetical protein SAMN04487916_1099 [Arthrobacter sp. ov407]|nr:hypothetical protein SAMN04487916_1099 [Arthrobacter sp. ov407]